MAEHGMSRPDYPRWLRKPVWRLDDAALLVLGIDPNSYPRPRVDPAYVGQLLRMKRTPPPSFWKLLRAAMNAEGRELAVLEYSSERVGRMVCAKVQPAAFVGWAKQAGYSTPPELSHLVRGTAQPHHQTQDKQALRIERIKQAVKTLGFDPSKIPYGGKREVEKVCLEDSKLFTPSTFKKAWQGARGQELVRTEGHSRYKNPT